MKKERFYAQKGNGEKINPGDGIVPIMRRRGKDIYDIIGTGFYVTRYGLFVTANHVMQELIDEKSNTLGIGYLVHLGSDSQIHLRRILVSNCNKSSDIAICQADNYIEKYPQGPLMNMRPRVSFKVPTSGSPLVTYAYPENELLKFNDPETLPTIRGDYFSGKFLRYVNTQENPMMPCAYYETSIEVRSGASGGPVFDSSGGIVGINCRGWDFGGISRNKENLSYIIPIAEALPITVSNSQIPSGSWENRQLPRSKIDNPLSFADLVIYQHVQTEQ